MKTPRVFLAEDDPVNLSIMQNYLQSLNLDVKTASHGEDFLMLCEQELPDIAFMDIEMPVLDGIRTLRAFHAKYGARIPVIAISGHQDFDYRKYGFSSAVVKPATQSQLLSIIHAHLPVLKQSGEQFIRKKVLEVCNHDLIFAQKMINLFIEQTEKDLNMLQQHCQQQNREDIRMILHRMKSTLGYMGLPEIRMLAQQLESSAKTSMPDPVEIENFISKLREKLPLFRNILNTL